jgi:hypothetical protein
MGQALKVLGTITGIDPLFRAIWTSWESFDSYGTVPKRASASLRLPAGEVSIAFQSGSKTSKGLAADLPTITDSSGRTLPVKFMELFQGPSITKTGPFSGPVVRKCFATAEVPAEGDYLVTAGACRLLIGSAGSRTRR